MRISANRLDLLLADRGMTGKMLAATSGVSRQTISTVKSRGTCNPITAAKLAAGLGVDPVALIEREVQ